MAQTPVTTTRRTLLTLACTALLVGSATSAFAQDNSDSHSLSAIAKTIVFDPTTYAPAAVAYTATRLDWHSSQIFFQHGFVEANRRFTISGLANDRPVSYREGNRKIATDALWIVQMSVVNNATSMLMERVLIQAHPEHRKLLRTLGWIERTAFASYWASRLSASHFAKWQENGRVARQLGYR